MKTSSLFSGFTLLAMLSTSALAMTTTSPQKNVEQKRSQWCWNASVRNLIYTESNGAKDLWQCDIANYVFGVDYACRYADNFESTDATNKPNWIKKDGVKDTRSILNHYGFNTLRYYYGKHAFATIKKSIDNNHGILTNWRWRNGVGHIVVANGYDVHPDGSQWVRIFDPWPGEGEKWLSYEKYSGGAGFDHTFEDTLRVVDF